jgi:hypothetical protein
MSPEESSVRAADHLLCPVPLAPNRSPCSRSMTRTGAVRARSGPFPDQPPTEGCANYRFAKSARIQLLYRQQTKNLLATLRRSTFRIGRKRRYRKTAVVSESYGISTRQQCEQRHPSATPDSTASQVSIGPDTTEPANAYASAGPRKRPPPPSLTRRQQSQH